MSHNTVLVWTNLWLIGLNLLPFPPLDGAEAWPLLRRLLSSRSRRRGRSSLPRPKRRPGESWRY